MKGIKPVKMEVMKKQTTIFLSLIILFVAPVLNAQDEINKEVRVVKPYTPTLSDAEKINLLPEFNDTTKVYNQFQYSIKPRRYSTNFRVKPITPAKMIGLPLKPLYKSQLSIGFGNYTTPFVELTVNQLRDRKNAIGLYVKHLSSAGKVKLENDKKVNAGFSDNLANFYGRRMFDHSVLEGSLKAGYNSVLYYGYNPVIDTVLDRDAILQRIYTAGAGIEYYSSNPDSSHFNYKTTLDYNFITDWSRHTEHGINLQTEFAKFFGDWYSTLEAGTELFSRSDNIDSASNLVVRLNPRVSKAGEEWRFQVGFNSAYDGKTGLSLYPRVEFEFNIVKNVLIPYMGITGYKEVNSYRSLLMENPFIMPGTIAENTDYATIGYFGLKGSYSSRMSFDFRFKYSTINYMHFFVNSVSDTLRNQFAVVHDDARILNFGGEVTWNHTDELKFMLRGDYSNYEMDNLEHPWHKPDLKVNFNASYNLREKIMIDGNLFYTGKRYALFNGDLNLPDEIIELKGFVDANLSAEYRYTSMLSFFLKLNNLTASRYQQWYLYPVQRFQAMVGFSYAL